MTGHAWSSRLHRDAQENRPALISEIVVDVLADQIAWIIHRQGGDHTRLDIAKNKADQTR
jgi:hypothetical protein